MAVGMDEATEVDIITVEVMVMAEAVITDAKRAKSERAAPGGCGPFL
jgi:hypothetical protein